MAHRTGSIPKETADFVVVTAPKGESDRAALLKLLNDLSTRGKIDVLADVLENVRLDMDILPELLERAAKDPMLFIEAAAALNLATYKSAVEELRMLINDNSVGERSFQNLLSENPWMFGSEYSELLDRRRWTRDEEQDFVVRRTTDNYIELIEIKTPLRGRPLFRHDQSHNTFYPGMDLSKVLGQVENYIEKIDRSRDAILANDGEDTTKIRAKIIIGQDNDQDQQEALRRFNGHLHRIEILTFDQLLKIAQRVLNYLEGVLRPSLQITTRPYSVISEEDDIPF